MKPAIAVLWIGHARTAYRCLGNQLANFVAPNLENYSFDHYIHTFNNLTETGWNDRRRWVVPADGCVMSEQYLQALTTCLEAVKVVSKENDPEDIALALEVQAISKGIGNFSAATKQYIRRSRAWKSFFSESFERERYIAFIVARFDNVFSSRLTFPKPEELQPRTYYAAWADYRPGAVDDRFALVTPDCHDFMENWGVRACDFIKLQTGDFMAEHATNFAIRDAGMRVAHLSERDPIKICRFEDGDIVHIRNFINDPTGVRERSLEILHR